MLAGRRIRFQEGAVVSEEGAVHGAVVAIIQMKVSIVGSLPKIVQDGVFLATKAERMAVAATLTVFPRR